MADDFFTEKPADTPAEEQPVEEVKVKVGEKEYSQEELQKLVELGEIGRESEEKFKTRIDRVWPRLQQTINEKAELQKQYDELQTRIQQPAQQVAQGQMTPEQLKAEAQKQARELGIPMNEDVRKMVVETIQGQRLLDDIDATIDEMKADGLPETTTEDILAHMQETGIRNPEKAYKDMFEKEWLEKQAEKLNEIKPKGMPTLEGSQAGSKQPAPVRITKDNLEQMVSAAISGEAQQ